MLLEANAHRKNRIGGHAVVDSWMGNMTTLMHGVCGRRRYCKSGSGNSRQPEEGGSNVCEMHFVGRECLAGMLNCCIQKNESDWIDYPNYFEQDISICYILEQIPIS